MSKVSIGIVSVAWLVAAVCFFIALPNNSWLWLLSVFKYAVVPASLVNCFCFMLLGLQFNSIEYMHVCTFGIIPYVICFSAGDLIFFILNLFMVLIYGAPMW